jgi:ribose transport system substrate-binding protein
MVEQDHIKRSRAFPRRTSHVSLVVAGVIAVAAALAACGGSGSGGSTGGGAESKGTIGISFPNATQEGAVQQEMTFAKKKAQELGYKLVVDDPGQDLNHQLNTINTWIQQRYPALIAVTLNPSVFGNVVKRADQNKVKWITYGSSLPGQAGEINMEQLSGGQTIGRLAGDWITKRLGGKAKVALLTYRQGAWAREREKGIVQGLKATAPNAKIVARQDALSETDGLSKMNTILQAQPDLNAVLAVEETASEGAYQAFLDKGHKPNDPKVFIGGIDGTLKALKLLKQGNTMYRGSAALSLKALGEGMASTAARLAGGGTGDYHVKYTPLTAGDPKAAEFLAEWGE